MTRSKTRLFLMTTVAAMIVLAPMSLNDFNFDANAAWAAGQGGGGGGGNEGGGGGGDAGPATGGNNGAGGPQGNDGGEPPVDNGETGFVAPAVPDPVVTNNATARGNGSGNTGRPPAQEEVIATEAPTLSEIFIGLAGEDEGDEESDRPEWAGVPGGRDGAGGGQPPTSGTTKGDLFGDLYVILRDPDGVPILSPEGYVQPIDAEGNLIPLDEDGHPLDESLTVEVELGRLNVGRAPTSVLTRRADEVIALLNEATEITTDAAGRLVLTVDGVTKTIDSPLENLAIYVALLTEGTIPGVTELPGVEYDFLIDGVFTQEDLAASVAFLAAATDKTGTFTADEIAYIDAFVGINLETIGNVAYSAVDYSEFTYDREAVYGDVTVEVLMQQPDGSWEPTVVNVYDAVFGGETATDAGTLDAYTLAAEDARMVVNFLHEYEVPVATL